MAIISYFVFILLERTASVDQPVRLSTDYGGSTLGLAFLSLNPQEPFRPNSLKVFLVLPFLFLFEEMPFALDVENEYRSSFEQAGKLVLMRLRPTAVLQWAKLLKNRNDEVENGGT